jgi:hypothetical protein
MGMHHARARSLSPGHGSTASTLPTYQEVLNPLLPPFLKYTKRILACSTDVIHKSITTYVTRMGVR